MRDPSNRRCVVLLGILLLGLLAAAVPARAQDGDPPSADAAEGILEGLEGQ